MIQIDEYTRLAAPDVTPDVEPLHNAKPPNVEIQHEKPEHRLMVYMKANGKSNAEVARQLGKTQAWVSQIVRQKWFRKRVLAEMKERSDMSIDKLLAHEAEGSLDTLIELRDHAQSEQVRATSAINILDRFLGKPTQRIEKQKTTSNRVEEIEQLQAELVELEAELNVKN